MKPPWHEIPSYLKGLCGIITFRYLENGGDPVDDWVEISGTAAELTDLKIQAVPAASSDPGGDPASWVVYNGGAQDEGTFTISDSEVKLTFSGDYTLWQRVGGALQSDKYTYTYEKTVTLGGDLTATPPTGVITYTDVLNDAKELLSEWDLTKDDQYPWRTDAATWLMPLVTRDAASAEPYIDWAVRQPTPPAAPGDPELDCRFNDLIIYTGDLRGEPMPAGYDKFWNYYHINWQRQLTNFDTTCSACEMSLGAYSTDFTGLPVTATQWTDYFVGGSMCGPGAHVQQIVSYNYSSGLVGILDGVRMVKWAETIESWPARNQARPCGHDAWLRNETVEYCVSSLAGPVADVYTLTLTSEDAPLAVGAVVGLSDGIYEVDAMTAALTYELTKLWDLNPDITDYNDCKTMKYPSARSICGELTANAVQTSPGVVTITVTRKHWLHVGSSVNFTGITGLGSSVSVVTVPTNLTFTVAGTLTAGSTSGSIAQSGTDVANDTTCSEKKFMARKWRSAHREANDDPGHPDYTLTAELLDYNYNVAAAPFVACCSPNGEAFANGVLYDFEDIASDQCWGEEWHMVFEQAIQDEIWEAKEDCAGPLVEDSSPCASDGDYLYHPLYEPWDTSLDVIMPQSVGAPWCESLPSSSPTVHNIREAWLLCDDWEDFANKKCP